MSIPSLLRSVAVLYCVLSGAHCKCRTTFITACEKSSDVGRYGNCAWKSLIVANDLCGTGTADPPDEILRFGTFDKAPNLEELFIVGKVTQIQPGAFHALHQLAYLKLHKNLIKVVSRGAFSNLTALFKLDLQDNSIENIEHGLFENSLINSVDLSHNKINNIQMDQVARPALKRLILTHNDIWQLVPGCFHQDLEYLNLDNNKIASIDDGVLNPLRNLKELILSNNKLKVIVLSFALPSLERLDLTRNEIQGIQRGSFKEFFELKHLLLGYNNITYLDPDIFSEDGSVEVLHLHHNALVNLDARVGSNLPNLREMSIGGNPWSCGCLDEITQYFSSKNIKQPECDREFFTAGLSPVCWVTGACTGNEVLTPEIDKEYRDALKFYNC